LVDFTSNFRHGLVGNSFSLIWHTCWQSCVSNAFSGEQLQHTSAHTHKNLWGTASALLALHISVLGLLCPMVGTCHFCWPRSHTPILAFGLCHTKK
jgi:hypothetical protein